MEWFRRDGKIDVVGERSENVLSDVSVLEKVEEIRMQVRGWPLLRGKDEQRVHPM